MGENSYTVSVSNTFDADSPEDAIMQMICWLQESAHCAGYRVEWEAIIADMFRSCSTFIDAEAIIRSKVDY
jgi:hypothetical protein